MEYIKRLRLCIRGMVQREAILLQDKGDLQVEIGEQEENHKHAGMFSEWLVLAMSF